MKNFILILIFICFNINMSKAQLLSNLNTLTGIGDTLQIAVPLAALATTLALKDKEGTTEFIVSYTLSELTAIALKPIVDETRPDGRSNTSFPSGHSMSAFAGSFFLWQRYGYKVGVPATMLAGIVGYSRVKAKRHYPHDVLASVAISGAYSFLFVHKYNNIAQHINLTYAPENNYIGLSFKTAL